MAHNQKFLEIVHKLGRSRYPLTGIYRRMQDKELFLAAYGKLYANSGATTPGIDPEDTVDGMSLARIDTLIEQLQSGTFQWTPVRRTYIPKRNGKRPLGLPPWNDKLLQEVIRMVLEAYYEPRFSHYSHGFRPERGCHTALQQIRQTWRGTKWFIEGDIRGCFDHIDHNVLLDILARDIKDNRFLKLIRQLLKAGYMENWQYHRTYSGVPQGSIVGPLLTNILLNELDHFVETDLLPRYNRGEVKAVNPAYKRINDRVLYARKQGMREKAKDLARKRRQIPSKLTHDPDYRRLHYNRYADDLILGLDGPRHEAVQIKEELKAFLSTIHLELSEEKTLITHAMTQTARYLGYDLRIAKDDNQLTNGHRCLNMSPVLRVPVEVASQWRRRYTRKGKPTHRADLIHGSDFEIIRTYGVEFQGIVNYYSLAYNVAKAFYPVKNAFLQSAAMTLVAKHKRPVRWVMGKYLRRSEEGVRALIVEVENPNHPGKPYRAMLGGKPIRTNYTAQITDPMPQRYLGQNELVRRLLANECELCGSTERINVHYVRKLADIKKRYRGRKEPPPWVRFMMERNRKTVVVCHQCHTAIHAGHYDGRKVNQDQLESGVR